MRSRLVTLLVACIALAACSARPDPLPSWRDGPSKRAILEFVERTTDVKGDAFIPPEERVAVLDNDGTLWAEQPAYFHLIFELDRLVGLAKAAPAWASDEPYASILAAARSGGRAAALATTLNGGRDSIAKVAAVTHAGLTPDEFDVEAKRWLATARHPDRDRRLVDLAYRPMLEVLDLLRANGFRPHIVSGGGIDFVRALADDRYGIPPERVIGSTGGLRLERQGDVVSLVKTPEIVFVDDGDGKPIAIERTIGRRPVIAFGNSDGDLAMLEWTASGPGPSLCVLIHHTDADREWAYDRASAVGRLDRGLDEAGLRGWTVVDMAREWETVFVPAAR